MGLEDTRHKPSREVARILFVGTVSLSPFDLQVCYNFEREATKVFKTKVNGLNGRVGEVSRASCSEGPEPPTKSTVKQSNKPVGLLFHTLLNYVDIKGRAFVRRKNFIA